MKRLDFLVIILFEIKNKYFPYSMYCCPCSPRTCVLPLGFVGCLELIVSGDLFQVVGVGVPNPYRIRPFLGAKVPLNSSFSPLIRMHNPHSSPLQVGGVMLTLITINFNYINIYMAVVNLLLN